ncbi:MAG: hypothetical protein HOP28_07430 [Gemmatimonadales bacterium]|nr:hypothetical protein [Gemmatimonadales bacterium]
MIVEKGSFTGETYVGVVPEGGKSWGIGFLRVNIHGSTFKKIILHGFLRNGSSAPNAGMLFKKRWQNGKEAKVTPLLIRYLEVELVKVSDQVHVCMAYAIHSPAKFQNYKFKFTLCWAKERTNGTFVKLKNHGQEAFLWQGVDNHATSTMPKAEKLPKRNTAMALNWGELDVGGVCCMLVMEIKRSSHE